MIQFRFFDRATQFADLPRHFSPGISFVNLNQTHSTDVLLIDDPARVCGPGIAKPKADAAVTILDNVALTVHTADCLPLLAFGDGVIGACHAGWRGLSDGIVEKWIAKMAGLGARKENIKIHAGPSIGPCHFEVGKDVATKIVSPSEFPVKFLGALRRPHDDPSKEFVDLRAVTRFKLRRLGVPEENIEISADCTFCDASRFFSYRRDHASGNRLEAVIVKSRD